MGKGVSNLINRFGRIGRSPDKGRAEHQRAAAADVANPTAQVHEPRRITHGFLGDALDHAVEAQGLSELQEPLAPKRVETAEVRFKEPPIPVHESWRSSPLGEAMIDGALDLNLLSPDIFHRLEPRQRVVLMELLGALEVAVESSGQDEGEGAEKRPMLSRLHDPLSLRAGGWKRNNGTENGAEAFARKVWASGDTGDFAMVFAAAPRLVLPMIRGDAARVLTVDQLSRVLNEMRRTENSLGVLGFSGEELDALGDLFSRYLEHNAGQTKESLEAALLNLYLGIEKALPVDTGPRTTGIVAGALVAGVFKFLDTTHGMHAGKARRLNEIATLGWATSGVVALAGGQVGLLAAGGALALVTYAVKRGSKKVDAAKQNFRNRVQGELQLHLLQGAENMAQAKPDPNRPMLPEAWMNEDGGYRGASDTAMHWITTTLKNNHID